MAKDYYKILGVNKNASEEELKKAYRKLAHEHHPDKAHGNEAKFKEINEAYQVLGNKTKRAQYDEYGQVFEGNMPGGHGAGGFGFGDFSGFQGGGTEWNVNFGEDMGDIFETIFDQFGGRSKRRRTYTNGSDIEIAQDLTLEEAFHGVVRNLRFKTQITCKECAGVGHDVSKGFTKCSSCEGKGEVRVEKNTFFGNFSQVKMCEVCMGRGETPNKSCATCKGRGRVTGEREVRVDMGMGIENGQIIQLKGMGEAGEHKSESGDLYVVVRVTKHAVFDRKKDDLYATREIRITDALLQRKMDMKDIGGETFSFTIPEGSDLTRELKIEGRGMPRFGSTNKNNRGNLYVKLTAKTPKNLTRKAKQLLEDLDKEL